MEMKLVSRKSLPDKVFGRIREDWREFGGNSMEAEWDSLPKPALSTRASPQCMMTTWVALFKNDQEFQDDRRELKQARGPSNGSTFHTDIHSLDPWQERQPRPSGEPIRSCLPSPPPPPFSSGAAQRLAFSPPAWQEAPSASSSWAS